MLIAISGTPGTGKSTVAKLLAKKLNLKYLNLNKLAGELGLIIGYDEKRKAKIIDVDALRSLELDDAVIEGHLAHYLNSDFLIILRCAPKELKERLEKRGWSKEKIRENVEAEFMNIIVEEAKELGKKFFQVDTTNRSPQEVVEKILKILEGRSSGDEVDFFKPSFMDF